MCRLPNSLMANTEANKNKPASFRFRPPGENSVPFPSARPFEQAREISLPYLSAACQTS